MALWFFKIRIQDTSYFVIIVALLLASWELAAPTATGLSPCLLQALYSVPSRFYRHEGATKANVRTAQAARTSLSKALKVSLLRQRNGLGVRPCSPGTGRFVHHPKSNFRTESGVDSHEMERLLKC